MNSIESTTEQDTVAALFLEKLEMINLVTLRDISPISYERNGNRVARAREVRKFFKELGIKGCSVTAPNYSMASTIEIRSPRFQYVPENPTLNSRNTRIRTLLETVLIAAYPNTQNRSDSMTDYYDSCWSIN